MTIFIFSHYKSMVTISCHSNQSSYLIGTKNNIISFHIFFPFTAERNVRKSHFSDENKAKKFYYLEVPKQNCVWVA